MTPRVFIPQIVMKYSQDLKRLVPVYDFAPASQHGQLTPVLGDDDNPAFLNRIIPKIKLALSDFTHEDYLLAVGDPCVIAACAGVIARRLPRITMLKWQREIRMYVKMEITL